MEKCPKCGNKLSPIDVLCPRCGALVENINVRLGVHANDPQKMPERAEKNAQTDSGQNENNKNATAEKPAFEAKLGDAAPETLQRKEQQTAIPDLGESFAVLLSSDGISSSNNKQAEIPSDSPPSLNGSGKQDTAEEIFAAVEPPVGSDSAVSEQKLDKPWLEIVEVEASPSPYLQKTPPSSDSNETQQDDIGRRYRKTQPETYAEKKERRKLNSVLTALIWCLLAAALFAGFYFFNNYVMTTYGSYPALLRELTGGKIDLSTGSALSASMVVLISETQANSISTHQFDVSIFGGKSVTVWPLGETYDMEKGKASFLIPDETLARALGVFSLEDTFTADNLSLMINTPSETHTYSAEPLKLKLNAASYARKLPPEEYTVTTDETINIAMAVSPDALVFINNTDYSPMISNNGHLSLILPLDTVGENFYHIDVRQPGRSITKDSITVVRELPQLALTPDSVYMRVYKDVFECTGISEPGATITCSSNGKVSSSTALSDGRYSIVCESEQLGLNMYGLRASSEGWKPSEAVIAVERLPNQDSFISKAQQLSVGDASRRFKSLSGKPVHLTGCIDHLEAALYMKTFVLFSGNSRLNCYYHGDADLENQNLYNVYGIPDTKTNSFYVMFVG